MASTTFTKGSPEQSAFRDFWELCQKYWIPEDTDEYWHGFINDGEQFYQKHKAQPMARPAVGMLMNYLENKYKEEKKNAET